MNDELKEAKRQNESLKEQRDSVIVAGDYAVDEVRDLGVQVYKQKQLVAKYKKKLLEINEILKEK